MAKQVFRLDFCGRGLTVETGEVAKQAGGAVLVRYDDTVVLSTATASKQAKEGIDFFPLTVLFEEKLYSVGKIPGGFLRREGRPSEHATLTARMIDRPIRPLFADAEAAAPTEPAEKHNIHLVVLCPKIWYSFPCLPNDRESRGTSEPDTGGLL